MAVHDKLTRRSFLALTAAVPSVAWSAESASQAHQFQYDHVIGTSYDMVVWARDAARAERANEAALEEIRRLASILSTRDPGSEISRMDLAPGVAPSRDLAEVLSAYSHWRERTAGALSIRPEGPGAARNVDALGKAYIIDRAAKAAEAAGGIDGLLLNIGGDMVARGRPVEIGVANPEAPQDNAPPLTCFTLHNAAAATSGAYARGAHLIDARSGLPAPNPASATVVARDAVTANALATTLCLTSADEGLKLVTQTRGAEALRIGSDGAIVRTPGFALLERPVVIPASARAEWPSGYELNITLTLTSGAPPRGRGGPGGPGGPGAPAGPQGLGGPGGRGGRGPGGAKRLYVAVWMESMSGKLVRVLAFWADKDRYYQELSSFFSIAGGTRGGGGLGGRGGPGGPGGFGARGQSPLAAFARATRSPGKYQLLWDGLDEEKKPVPAGTYRVVVETNQEHGQYAKQAGTIDCADKTAELTLSATSNFEAVSIQYGARPKQA